MQDVSEGHGDMYQYILLEMLETISLELTFLYILGSIYFYC